MYERSPRVTQRSTFCLRWVDMVVFCLWSDCSHSKSLDQLVATSNRNTKTYLVSGEQLSQRWTASSRTRTSLAIVTSDCGQRLSKLWARQGSTKRTIGSVGRYFFQHTKKLGSLYFSTKFFRLVFCWHTLDWTLDGIKPETTDTELLHCFPHLLVYRVSSVNER